MQPILILILLAVPVLVHAEYLGDLSSNSLNPNSIFNDIGPYGSLSPKSPRNSLSPHGNPISPYSATNPLATERYGSPLSPDSINNSLGAGSPLLYDSPTNSFGRGWRIEGK